ncbi:MAG: glucose-6-phosphate dehydrogenase [Candidatus Saccharimonadales bacterium]|nr:glucose-6-phosphate dehydrogenase [Candidatus Saccharimonadales bacterium]
MQLADPVILTIIGITGDLSRRYLLPSLYHLELDNLLPDDFMILGTSRRDLDKDEFKQKIRDSVQSKEQHYQEEVLDRLMDRLQIAQVDTSNPDHYQQLADILHQMESRAERCTEHVFYLAVPPEALANVVDLIGHSEVQKCSHGANGRLLIEKPFGRDKATAEELSNILSRHFKEEQIYRIDHYLAKETAQNILHFRFKNPLVADIWNSKFIDHIQITAAESINIEGRRDFYEQTGAVRDFAQSHLLQLLALVTMDRPAELDAQHVRASREKLLAQIKPIDNHPDQVVRGQYNGYREEADKPDSNIETFVAMKVEIDSDRWRGVPIYLRTGKAMEKRITEINLVYQDEKDPDEPPNVLTIRIQPREGIGLTLQAKKPGLDTVRQNVVLEYCYRNEKETVIHNAYERLLIDAMRGDQMLFPTTQEVLTSWEIVDPLLKAWSQSSDGLTTYAQGSWGPEEANLLISHDSHLGWLTQGDKICIDK